MPPGEGLAPLQGGGKTAVRRRRAAFSAARAALLYACADLRLWRGAIPALCVSPRPGLTRCTHQPPSPAAKSLGLGLASAALLVQPARAEADAVDATVSAVTEVVKVRVHRKEQRSPCCGHARARFALLCRPTNRILFRHPCAPPAARARTHPPTNKQARARAQPHTQATGAAVKTGIDLVGAGAKALKEGYDVAAPYIQQGVDAVAPLAKEAVKVTTEVAGPALTKAVPAVQVRAGGAQGRWAAGRLRQSGSCGAPLGRGAPRCCGAGRSPTHAPLGRASPPQDTLTGVAKSTGIDLDVVAKTTATAAKTATDGAVAAKPVVEQVGSSGSSARLVCARAAASVRPGWRNRCRRRSTLLCPPPLLTARPLPRPSTSCPPLSP